MTPVPLGHKLGVETTAMIRAHAGISYALTEAMDEGHCGLPTAEPAQLAEEILRFRGLWSRRRHRQRDRAETCNHRTHTNTVTGDSLKGDARFMDIRWRLCKDVQCGIAVKGDCSDRLTLGGGCQISSDAGSRENAGRQSCLGPMGSDACTAARF